MDSDSATYDIRKIQRSPLSSPSLRVRVLLQTWMTAARKHTAILWIVETMPWERIRHCSIRVVRLLREFRSVPASRGAQMLMENGVVSQYMHVRHKAVLTFSLRA